MPRRLAGLLTLAVLAGVPAGCAAEPPAAPTSSTTSSARPATSPSPSPSRSAAPRRLVGALEDVAEAHPEADVAMAFAPVGPGEVRVAGEAPKLVAWSTIKVPLALAVVRAGDGDLAGSDIDLALASSDNAAAGRLWDRLGGAGAAADAVEAQLRRGGDERTEVPPQATVAGFSPFGQSLWRLTDQTRFTAALPCLAGSSTILDVMDRVVDGQRWGLGGINGARFKGGWGSTPEGYVVRQLGIVPGTKGDTAVTLQVRTGTHEQATAIADELVTAMRTNRDQLPIGTCD